MTKKKIIRKTNRPLNIFDDGGQVDTKTAKRDKLSGAFGDIGDSIGTIINSGVQNAKIADTSGISNNISASRSNQVSATTNDDLLSEWGAYSPMEEIDSWRDIKGGSTGQRLGNTAKATVSGVSTGVKYGGVIGGIIGGVAGLGSSIGGWISGNSKAKKKARKLNNQIDSANYRSTDSLSQRAETLDSQNDNIALANYSAFGGPLDFSNQGAINYGLMTDYLNNKNITDLNKTRLQSMPNSYMYNDDVNTLAAGGTIHINPNNIGKFNATKNRTGKTTEELTHSKNALTRKRAIFAQNAAKWNHSNGGYLFENGGNLYSNIPNETQHGGIFSNGVTKINNGGTHEENPNGGVNIGKDSNGVPNLVEEGEVKFNNYIFSNRLFPTKELLKQYNLPQSYEKYSFAALAEKVNKESSERPNDPISKNGLYSSMSRLRNVQEEIREIEKAKAENKKDKIENTQNMYPYGGEFNKFNPRKYNTHKDFTPNGFQFKSGDVGSNIRPELLNIDNSFINKYNNSNSDNTENTENNEFNVNKKNGSLSDLRYVPILGSALGVTTDALGLTNKPDYKNADLILDAEDGISNINYNPIGNYLTYNPLDRNYYINQLNAQAGATRNAIINNAGGNRATAAAGLLAADYNANNSYGNLARQAEEYNNTLRERVETFNRGTNQFNSEAALKADMANKEDSKLRLQSRIAAAQLRDSIDTKTSTAKSANLTNLFNSIGDIGVEDFNRNMINSSNQYYGIDSNGNLYYKKNYYKLSNKEKAKVNKDLADKGFTNSEAYGGYLTIR